MKIDLKKILLAGTALVAVSSFAVPAQAAVIELGPDNAVVNGVSIANGDNIVDLVDDADDNLDIDLDGTALTIGVNDTTIGIDATGGGDADASNIFITNQGAAAATLTVQGDGTDSILKDGSGFPLTITIGEDSAAAAGAFATNVTVVDDVTGGGDDINFLLTGFNGNTLTFQGDVDLTAGTITLEGVADSVVFAGTAAQGVTGTIDSGTGVEGTISVTNTGGLVTFNSDIGTTQNLLAFTLAANADAETVGELNATTITLNSGSTLTANDAVTGTVSVATGGVLDVGAGLLTGATTLTGTGEVNLTGTGGVTGNIIGASIGAGVLNVDEDATVAGSIGVTGVSSLSSITVAEGKALTISSAGAARTVAATTILLEDAASDVTDASIALVLGNNVTFSNAITVGIDGEGAITGGGGNGNGTVTFSAAVGTSTVALGAITLADDVDTVGLTTTKNLYVDAITLGQNDTLTLSGSTAQTISGTVDGAINKGAIVVGTAGGAASDVTFAGAVGGGATLATLEVKAAATATFSSTADFGGTFTSAGTTYFEDDATFGGAVTNTGTVQIAAGKTLGTTDVVDASASTFNIVVSNNGVANSFGQITESADNVDFSNDTINFVVDSTNPLTVGVAALDNVFAGNAQNVIAGATITDNSFLYGFALVDDTNNVDVTITEANTMAATADTPGNLSLGNLLQGALVASVDADVTPVQGALAAAADANEVNDVLEAAQPAVDGGAVTSILAFGNQALDIADEQLAALRTGEETGMAAGNAAQGLRIWAQAFGNKADQQERDNIPGYTATTWGGVVGLDTQNTAHDAAAVGIALGYGSTQADSDNANQANTDVDSYQVSLYGNYDLDSRTYISGQASYGWSSADTDRVSVGNLITGSYDAKLFGIRGEVGRDYQYGDATLTPAVKANWVHYSPDDYVETGIGGLTVQQESMNIAELGLGVRAKWNFVNADGSHTAPELHAGYRYDFIGDAVETVSAFNGVAGTFSSQGADPAQHKFNAGAGITWANVHNWDFTLSYDADYKADYLAHNAFIRAGYNF